MKFDSPFARDAARGAVVMVLLPLLFTLVVARLIDQMVGVQMDWQDLARGVAITMLVYAIVMRQRYLRYFQ
jgi:predicted Na+-dependent transporter